MKTRPRAGDEPFRIALYFGGDPSLSTSNTFYLSLFWQMTSLCHERGMECLTFFDTRPMLDQATELPEMAQAVKDGRVDAVIAAMFASDRCVTWLGALGMPCAIHSASKDERVADFDHKQMFRIALRSLADHECESVGIIVSDQFSGVSMLEFVRSLARRFRIKMEYEWMLFHHHNSTDSPEKQGYDLFRSLWSLKKRPQGLIVFPDIVARGVITAVVESRVSQNVRLVLHRNLENPIMVPFEVTWLESSASSLAEALLLQIKRQREGESLKNIQVPFHLFSGVRETDR